MLVGPHSPRGGRADVYVDEKKRALVDFYIVPNTTDDSLWHVYGLRPGQHTLRLVTRDDADPRSQGRECFVLGAITYR